LLMAQASHSVFALRQIWLRNALRIVCMAFNLAPSMRW
jgi:hypothetical protein